MEEAEETYRKITHAIASARVHAQSQLHLSNIESNVIRILSDRGFVKVVGTDLDGIRVGFEIAVTHRDGLASVTGPK